MSGDIVTFHQSRACHAAGAAVRRLHRSPLGERACARSLDTAPCTGAEDGALLVVQIDVVVSRQHKATVREAPKHVCSGYVW